MTGKSRKETLWEKQNNSLRAPNEVFGSDFENSGLGRESLNYKIEGEFAEILKKKGITLLISREYENLMIALSCVSKKLKQTFFHLPHPSGIAVDRKNNSVYVASTRNPNQIIEFKPVKRNIYRKEDILDLENSPGNLTPSRSKYYAGSYYFHELAFIGNGLYANAVGLNGIISVNIDFPSSEEVCWWPKCMDKNGKSDSTANYIQLNSIAAGRSIEESYFTASGTKKLKIRPGHKNFRTDKRGVVFSGRTREVVAGGLTRPHSAKLFNGKIWLNNSGYGETGFIDDERFIPVVELPGWTRGLCIIDDIIFIGVSRVLPKFESYAPGLKRNDYICSVYAIDKASGKILGAIKWPFGNQIFAIDWISDKLSRGFIFENFRTSDKKVKSSFYRYRI